MAEQIETIRSNGLFLVADPHLAGTPPGQRLEGFREQILAKVGAALARAAKLEMTFVFLGDLFHWPRDNPNSLIVELIELFRPHRPFALVGNHDKYQSRLTPDCSIAVLEAAGVVRLIKDAGPVFRLETPTGDALVGASPDGTIPPRSFTRLRPAETETVLWLTHHNVNFPDYPDKQVKAAEIPGVDMVVNGHIHRPQPTLVCGGTRWANPGNVTRLTFSRLARERVPAAALWRPGDADLSLWPVPHLDFFQVFPDQEFPEAPVEADKGSLFLAGLERLAWRRTGQGVGLKQFLDDNLDPGEEETPLIWDLYEEITGHDG